MTNSHASEPSERDPLLSSNRQNSNGTIPRSTDPERPGDGSSDVPIAEEPTTAKQVIILGSIYFGIFLAALDSTIIATLAGPISSEFHSLSVLSWLVSAYLIANAALQPITGQLTDIFSRRWGLVFSNIFFCAGNLICGLARTKTTMILGRVVAGIGGGGLTAIATFVASDLIPLRKRGIVQGIGNLFFGAGSGLGGVYGGWINDVLDWRSAFLIQVPFIVVSGILVAIFVKIPIKETSTSRLRRIDYPGAITLILALVLLLVGLNSGGNTLPWTHPLVLTSIPLSLVSLLAFIYIEARVASEPVIPVTLLLNRTVAAACLTNWFVNMAWFALLIYVPIWIQLQGHSTTEAGVRIIPCSVGGALGSLLAGIIMKATGRYYYIQCIFSALLVGAFGATLSFTLNYPAWPTYIIFGIAGLGFGGMLTVTLLSLIAGVPHEVQAVITSASYAFRSTGSILGITIASAVYQNVLEGQLTERLGRSGPSGKELARGIRDDLGAIGKLPTAKLRHEARESYMDALRGVFVTAFVLCTLGAFASLWIREHKLHSNLARK